MARCGLTAKLFRRKFPECKAAPERRVHLSERAEDAGHLAALGGTLGFARGRLSRRLSPRILRLLHPYSFY